MSEEEVPAICEACLGKNPYLKMIKDPGAAQCTLCTRPFTVFKWNTDKGSKFSKTRICLTCARQRNCCQSCMLDLTYGIPLHLRDAAFKMAGLENENEVSYSSNSVTKRYNALKADQKKLKQTEDKKLLTSGEYENEENKRVEEAKLKVKEILEKLSEKQKLSNKHESSSKSNKKEKQLEEIKERSLKNVDVSKIVKNLPFNGNLAIPKDESITSFFLFGINDEMSNILVGDTISDLLAPQKVSFSSVIINQKSKCGFVTFNSRKQAEEFANIVKKPREFKGPGILFINNTPIRIAWGKTKSLGSTNLEQLKIASLVKKQMKLLAERDKGLESLKKLKNDRRSNINSDKIKLPTPGTNIKYASLRADYED